MIGHYQLIETTSQLEQIVARLRELRSVGVKLNTTGHDPLKDQLTHIYLSESNRAYVIRLDQISPTVASSLLKSLFEAVKPTKVFHNAKPSLKFLLYHLGLDVRGIFDTMLASQLLTAGLENKHSLEVVVERARIRVEMSSNDQSHIDQDEIAESAKAVISLLPLYDGQRLKLRDARLIEIAKLEFDTVRSVAAMELRGFLLDVDKWQSLLDQLRLKHSSLAMELKRELRAPGVQQLSFFDDGLAINLDSPQQVLKSLQEAGISIPSTRAFYLHAFAEDYPVLEKFIEYRGLQKLITSYGDNVLKFVEPLTGRIHATFHQLASATGRFACSSPNLQQIPRSVDYRSCFIAPPGRRLIVADYSQIELRILAGWANDETLIEAFRSGVDLHKVTASQMFGIPLDSVTPEYRSGAKALNYGLVYGMGARGLAARIGSSLPEAEQLIKKYFATYRGVARWLRDAGERAVTTGEARTKWDRVVYFKFDPNNSREVSAVTINGKNVPIQGSGSDMNKRSLVLIHEALSTTSAYITNTIHDEVVIEVDDNQAEEIAGQIERLMIQAGNEVVSNVPIEVDLKIAQTWQK